MRIASRGSRLARWQAGHVAELLRRREPDLEVEVVVVETTGDRRPDTEIWEMGGKGVFVKEVQAAVVDGRADLAVHSAKDLPSATPDGLVLAAVPERDDPRDVLVGSTLAGLPVGGRVATGSVRRRVQLADHRPDLTFTGLRGNIETRLAKVGEVDAVVMAAAALRRLGLEPPEVEVLDPAVVLPQAAQGALAVECRASDHATRDRLAAIEDRPSRRAVDAERAFLAELGGDCSLPAGAWARPADGDTGELVLEGLLTSLDGHIILRHRAVGSDPDLLGRDAVRYLLDNAGGRFLLAV